MSRVRVLCGERSCYIPRYRVIILRPDATLYTRFHELAHAEQHEKWAPVFIVNAIFRLTPFLGWMCRVWIERDAMKRTEKRMRELGVWSKAAEQQARSSLNGYRSERKFALPKFVVDKSSALN